MQIDVVPRAEEVGGFPGLYCSNMTPHPWLADNRTLLLTTYWRSTTAIIAAHVERYGEDRWLEGGKGEWGGRERGCGKGFANRSTMGLRGGETYKTLFLPSSFQVPPVLCLSPSSSLSFVLGS